MNEREREDLDPCGLDNYIQRVLDRSPKVKSPSGREYNLFALKALVLALRTCRIERDRKGHATKRWGMFAGRDDRKGRR